MSPAEMSGRADQLARQAREAAVVRALAAHPDVVALRVERVGAQVDALLWVGIGLALLFTTVNVQRFAAGGAPAFTPVWWAAWLLDPMVSLVLLAAEAGPQLREQLARAATATGRDGPTDTVREPDTSHESGAVGVHEPRGHLGGPQMSVAEPADSREPVADGTRSSRRRMLGDYLAEARAALAAAAADGDPPPVTPSWCRAVTGCSAGTSVKLAAALRVADAEALAS